MKTYIAKLIFNINVNQGQDRTQFDEQVRIIRANTMQAAIEIAKNIGEAEESTFISPKQQLIKWEFIAIFAIYELDSMQDGQQLYSYSLSKKDANNFIQYTKDKFQEIIPS